MTDTNIPFMNPAPPGHVPQASPLVSWRTDAELKLIDNQGDVELFSLPAEQILLHPLETASPAGLVQIPSRALRGTPGSCERTLGARTYLVTVAPECDETGQVTGCKAVAVDISAYKAAEQTAAVLQTQAESILHAAGEGIYGLNLDGRATFVNPAAERMTGWSAEETIGKIIHYLHHHSHEDGTPYPHENCPIYAAIQDGEVHHIKDEKNKHKNNNNKPKKNTNTPIYEGGKLAGAVVVFKDTSERKKAQRQLITAFEEVARLKEQLQEQ